VCEGTGKTGVVQRYIHGRPPADSYAATLMDQFTYAVNVGQRTVHVHLWDTRTLSSSRARTHTRTRTRLQPG
jgi:GTPase SAR1 family protein